MFCARRVLLNITPNAKVRKQNRPRTRCISYELRTAERQEIPSSDIDRNWQHWQIQQYLRTKNTTQALSVFCDMLYTDKACCETQATTFQGLTGVGFRASHLTGFSDAVINPVLQRTARVQHFKTVFHADHMEGGMRVQSLKLRAEDRLLAIAENEEPSLTVKALAALGTVYNESHITLSSDYFNHMVETNHPISGQAGILLLKGFIQNLNNNKLLIQALPLIVPQTKEEQSFLVQLVAQIASTELPQLQAAFKRVITMIYKGKKMEELTDKDKAILLSYKLMKTSTLQLLSMAKNVLNGSETKKSTSTAIATALTLHLAWQARKEQVTEDYCSTLIKMLRVYGANMHWEVFSAVNNAIHKRVQSTTEKKHLQELFELIARGKALTHVKARALLKLNKLEQAKNLILTHNGPRTPNVDNAILVKFGMELEPEKFVELVRQLKEQSFPSVMFASTLYKWFAKILPHKKWHLVLRMLDLHGDASSEHTFIHLLKFAKNQKYISYGLNLALLKYVLRKHSQVQSSLIQAYIEYLHVCLGSKEFEDVRKIMIANDLESEEPSPEEQRELMVKLLRVVCGHLKKIAKFV